MKILNIHGYKGSPENSACYALKNLGFEVVSPEINYDSSAPEQVYRKLCSIITENEINMIAGTSLGGFYGTLLSAELDMPAVLVNPCLMPFVYLPRLGFTGDIMPYIKMFGKISDIRKQNISVIIGGQDEIIDSHDFTRNLLENSRFRIVPDGRHSGATLPLESYFRDIF